MKKVLFFVLAAIIAVSTIGCDQECSTIKINGKRVVELFRDRGYTTIKITTDSMDANFGNKGWGGDIQHYKTLVDSEKVIIELPDSDCTLTISNMSPLNNLSIKDNKLTYYFPCLGHVISLNDIPLYVKRWR